MELIVKIFLGALLFGNLAGTASWLVAGFVMECRS